MKKCEKEKIYVELIRKVVNTKFSDVLRMYREEKTVRGSKDVKNNYNLHQSLDGLSGNKRTERKIIER